MGDDADVTKVFKIFDDCVSHDGSFCGFTQLVHFEFFSAIRTRRMLNTARLRFSRENPNCAQMRKISFLIMKAQKMPFALCMIVA